MTNDYSELTIWQQKILENARQLKAGSAPYPWQNHQTAYAAGIFAAGWTKDSNFVMLSGDGYSITDPITGKQLLFDTDTDSMYENLDEFNTVFFIPSLNETIKLFGLNSGDGIHVCDSWILEIIYPNWPNSLVILHQSDLAEWKDIVALKLDVSDAGNWRKAGFSPSRKSFAVVGHAGADFFSRID